MDFTIIKEFIKPELLVLVAVLYITGIALKKAATVNDTRIPLILGIIGILLAMLYVGATSDLSTTQDVLLAIFAGVTQGILCAGASVYTNQ